MEQNEIKRRIDVALDRLYELDHFLIDNNLCERCINHRFALHLQNQFTDHFVDCEYNRSHIGNANDQKRILGVENGNYVDIIVGLRSRLPQDDFICFETKKHNNVDQFGIENDRRKLQILTGGGQFEYKYGFRVVFGSTRETVLIEAYQRGDLIEWI